MGYPKYLVHCSKVNILVDVLPFSTIMSFIQESVWLAHAIYHVCAHNFFRNTVPITVVCKDDIMAKVGAVFTLEDVIVTDFFCSVER